MNRTGDSFNGKKVTVIGLAREGLALTRFLSACGALVTVSDSKTALELGPALRQLEGLGARYSLGANRVEDALGADMVFASPGVPPNLAPLEAARRAGIPISSATRLFFQLCPGRIVGVTGSCGKSTTTSLIGRMLEATGKKALVGGNLGTPLLDRLPEMDRDTWAVLELSSFQLESMEESPHIAIITNLRPDHLDRHPSLKDYTDAKANIFLHQEAGDYLLLNYDDPAAREMAGQAPSRVLFFSLKRELESGGFIHGGNLMVSVDGRKNAAVCSELEVRLLGRHNLYNVLAASLAAALCEVEPRVAGQVARSFQGLPHRLELVRQVKGVSYYDDSIATTPDRAVAALNSFTRPVILIAGGRDKNLPLEPFTTSIQRRCKAVILYGEGGGLLQDALAEHGMPGNGDLIVYRTQAFQGAVEKAASLATAGDVVLLAPGFASFDQFSSYEERGKAFSDLVGKLR
ncbi:MAG TPA: UDP-N-acetylmuramoyl-L-alanine--D-glutamate ligase [Dehalococcoidia bacterium]|nr:UDP-N-acetylmuramoyl-L-alanine--D-glutamate ligase [Dehalococcoidia bacterium]